MSGNEVANGCPDVAVVGGDLAVVAIQKVVERLASVVDVMGEIRRGQAGAGQVIQQLQADLIGFRKIGRLQLSACDVGKSHGYSPSVSSQTMSSMKPGLAGMCR